jgi:hypothetical protein
MKNYVDEEVPMAPNDITFYEEVFNDFQAH